jgi:hypothetical protein
MILNMIGEEHTLLKQIDRFLGCFLQDPRFGLFLGATSINTICDKSKALLRSSEQYAPLKDLPDYIRRNWVEDIRFQERIRGISTYRQVANGRASDSPGWEPKEYGFRGNVIRSDACSSSERYQGSL